MMLLRKLSHITKFLFREGGWTLYDHEKFVLDAALEHLCESERSLVLEQLKQDYFIERGPDGRINVFRYYSFDKHLLIQKASFDDFLLNVEVLVDGKKQISKVTFYQGQLFSIEMKKAKHFYKDCSLLLIKVIEGKPNKSYTESIDRHEHGVGQI